MNIALAGPIGAGKTTYVVALWHFLCSTIAPSGLSFEAHPRVRDKLVELESAWLSCTEVPHTSDTGPVDFDLGTVALGDDRAQLVIPDRAGESFVHQWADRRIDRDYAMALKDAAGVALFVHPGHIRKPHLIEEINRDLGEIVGEHEPTGDGGPSTADASAPPWDPMKAPSEVILVELLQFARHLRSEGSSRLSLVISAWDTVERPGLTPASWLQTELPLLAQYVDSNRAYWKTSVFGVSATGGDLQNSDVRKRLQSLDDPNDRTYVVTSDGHRSNDLTLPIVGFLQTQA